MCQIEAVIDYHDGHSRAGRLKLIRADSGDPPLIGSKRFPIPVEAVPDPTAITLDVPKQATGLKPESHATGNPTIDHPDPGPPREQLRPAAPEILVGSWVLPCSDDHAIGGERRG
jgi:hypothetical protein